MSPTSLVHAVLRVEQLMTAGASGRIQPFGSSTAPGMFWVLRCSTLTSVVGPAQLRSRHSAPRTYVGRLQFNLVGPCFRGQPWHDLSYVSSCSNFPRIGEHVAWEATRSAGVTGCIQAFLLRSVFPGCSHNTFMPRCSSYPPHGGGCYLR